MNSFSVLNNISSLMARNALQVSGTQLQKTLLRLSTGSRINSGGDDAAGLAIADGLRAQVRALEQASRNANDGIGFLQVADGALAEVTNLVTRAVTLAEQSATGTVTDTQRAAIQAEFDAITAEIDRIGSETTYNGVSLFAGTATDIFVGDTTSVSKISFTVQSLSAAAIVDGAGGNSTDIDALVLSTQAGAEAALDTLNTAVANIANQRATLGAVSNRLEASIVVIGAQAQNAQAAESQIRDADIAAEMASMTKLQILQQTGMAALATANQQGQSVLSLFR